ncbi:single-stranded DNA-binding protein [Tsukamurella sp. 1534]|uniref:single-stranded DNA-binding protein n=1 Tax=Tsukamurella sp. 1534 TaxID=1151061 RepID=UPI00030FD864|nr:single-stranded DNA-binding protein [Tsukamurella sp. 1534]
MPGVMIFAAGFVTNELFYRESERDPRHDFLSFTMAHNNGYVDENGTWQQTSTLWLNVKAFGALARNARGAIAKGRPVMVHGELKHETFDGTDGHKHSSLDLKADAIGLNLRLCSSHYAGAGERTRAMPGAPDQAGGSLDGAPAAERGEAIESDGDRVGEASDDLSGAVLLRPVPARPAPDF